MKAHLRTILSGLLLLILAAACSTLEPVSLTETPTPVVSPQAPSGKEAESPPYLATPHAQSPTAGICGSFNEDYATITIYPDIPDPRCLEIKPEQRLKVTNRTEGKIQVKIGLFQAEIKPNEVYIFDEPVGEYLAPGVHRVQVSPCCSSELMLVTDSP
jgi:hypothetical protein